MLKHAQKLIVNDRKLLWISTFIEIPRWDARSRAVRVLPLMRLIDQMFVSKRRPVEGRDQRVSAFA